MLGDPRVVPADAEGLEAELEQLVDRAREFGLTDETIAAALGAAERKVRRNTRQDAGPAD